MAASANARRSPAERAPPSPPTCRRSRILLGFHHYGETGAARGFEQREGQPDCGQGDITPRQQLWKDVAYVALAAVSLPFTLLEAACRAGSTIMVEARKKS